MLRPLHEANADSGLAVAACMRSTGGPMKRRQEQEMERESGSARPQGPRRYHHCPPLCVHSGACLKTPPPPPSSLCMCPLLKLRHTSVCVLWVLAATNTSATFCVCVSSHPAASNPRSPFINNNNNNSRAHPAVCVYVSLNVC